jgi:hypothetical protein
MIVVNDILGMGKCNIIQHMYRILYIKYYTYKYPKFIVTFRRSYKYETRH